MKRVNNKIPEKPILQRLSTDLHFVQKSELPCNDKTAGPCEDIIVRPHPKIIRRSVHPAVREAQCKLNMFHEQQVKQGLPGLVDAPLVLDCIFGQKTFNATVSFQRIVFPKDPQFHTGNIFEKTWAKLDEVTTATPKIPETGIIIPDISGPTPVPLCSAVPTSVPTTCSARHDAYCEVLIVSPVIHG